MKWRRSSSRSVMKIFKVPAVLFADPANEHLLVAETQSDSRPNC